MLGPNITGEIAKYVSVNKGVPSGAFSVTKQSVEALNGHASGNVFGSYIGFDASEFNNAYGRSSSIQPDALQILMIIKV